MRSFGDPLPGLAFGIPTTSKALVQALGGWSLWGFHVLRRFGLSDHPPDRPGPRRTFPAGFQGFLRAKSWKDHPAFGPGQLFGVGLDHVCEGPLARFPTLFRRKRGDLWGRLLVLHRRLLGELVPTLRADLWTPLGRALVPVGRGTILFFLPPVLEVAGRREEIRMFPLFSRFAGSCQPLGLFGVLPQPHHGASAVQFLLRFWVDRHGRVALSRFGTLEGFLGREQAALLAVDDLGPFDRLQDLP